MAIELAKAYVQIIPSFEGLQTEMEKGIGKGIGSTGTTHGETYGNKFVEAAKKIITGAAIGKVVKESLDAGGALQQSIGGIETLFGTGGNTIVEYAEKQGKAIRDVCGDYGTLVQAERRMEKYSEDAWKSAGLSQNDYNETVISFAASLAQSVEDPIELADAANQAVIDMADNANKMGTDMESIQNAYRGFAKQNYTMLRDYLAA